MLHNSYRMTHLPSVCTDERWTRHLTAFIASQILYHAATLRRASHSRPCPPVACSIAYDQRDRQNFPRRSSGDPYSTVLYSTHLPWNTRLFHKESRQPRAALL